MGAKGARADSPTGNAQFGLKSRPLISVAGIVAALNQWPLVALLCAAALVRVILVLISLQGRYANNDYSGYYLAAYAMRHGLDPYRLDLTALGRSLGLQIGYLIHAADTPSFLAMFEPLTLLSPRPAYWTWMGLNATAFVAALIMLLWRADGMKRPTLWLLVALAVLYPPLTFNMGWGQSQPLVLFLLALAMTALESRRDALAGLALAAAALLRAFPMLMAAYLLLRGKWRALLWMGIGLGAGGVATLAVVGVPRCASYVSNIKWVTGYLLSGRPADIGLRSFVSRLFWYSFGWPLGVGAELAREIAVWIARAGVLAATIIATPIGKAYEDRDNRAFSLWVAAAIFLSPIEWAHYMVLLLIPFLNMARAACAGRVGERSLWMAVANIVYSAFWIRIAATTIPEFWAGFGPHPPLPLMLIAESGVAVMLMGYVAAYWFAIDRGGAGQAVVEPPLVRSTLPA